MLYCLLIRHALFQWHSCFDSLEQVARGWSHTHVVVQFILFHVSIFPLSFVSALPGLESVSSINAVSCSCFIYLDRMKYINDFGCRLLRFRNSMHLNQRNDRKTNPISFAMFCILFFVFFILVLIPFLPRRWLMLVRLAAVCAASGSS